MGNAARKGYSSAHIYDLLVPPKVYALKPRHLAHVFGPASLLEKVKEISEIRKLQDKEYKEIGHYTKGLSVYHGVASAITINRYTHTTVVPAKLVWKTWTTTALG